MSSKRQSKPQYTIEGLESIIEMQRGDVVRLNKKLDLLMDSYRENLELLDALKADELFQSDDEQPKTKEHIPPRIECTKTESEISDGGEQEGQENDPPTHSIDKEGERSLSESDILEPIERKKENSQNSDEWLTQWVQDEEAKNVGEIDPSPPLPPPAEKKKKKKKHVHKVRKRRMLPGEVLFLPAKKKQKRM